MKIKFYKPLKKFLLLSVTIGCTLVTGCSKDEKKPIESIQKVINDNKDETFMDEYLTAKDINISVDGKVNTETLNDAVAMLEEKIELYKMIPNIDLGNLTYEKENLIEYIVEPGDTLELLGKKFGISVEDIKNKNDLSSDEITIGQKLIINTSQDLSSAEIKELLDKYKTTSNAEEKIELAKKLKNQKSLIEEWLINNGDTIMEGILKGIIKCAAIEAYNLTDASIDKVTISSDLKSRSYDIYLKNYTIVDDELISGYAVLKGKLRDALESLYEVQLQMSESTKKSNKLDIKKYDKNLKLVKTIVNDYNAEKNKHFLSTDSIELVKKKN